MSKAEYNFNKNLLKASSCNSLQEAKTEWVEVYEEVRINKDGLCICQRNKLKFIKYFYNVKTKNTIIVGSKCCKTFDFNANKIKNKILKEIIQNNILKGEYQIIDNIIEYTNSVEKQLIEYFEKYTLSKNISELKKDTEDIKILIDEYKLNYLLDIYNILTDLINLREKEKEEEEKLKVYCIEIRRRNYIPGAGTDVFVDNYKFSTIKECEDCISKLQIGVTITSKYREENTIENVDILLNNKIIKHYNKKNPFKVLSPWEERQTLDGKIYWYHSNKYISTYTNPHIWNVNNLKK
jgi:hypothetical protein